jgi:transposase-like protein
VLAANRVGAFPPYLEQVYNVEVSPELRSRVTDAVTDEVVGLKREWQGRQPDKSYAIVYDETSFRRTR